MPRVKVSNVVIVDVEYGLSYIDIIGKPGLYQPGKPHGPDCECKMDDTYILVTEVNPYIGMPSVLSVYPEDTERGGPLGIVKPGSRWMNFKFRPVRAEVVFTFDGATITPEMTQEFIAKHGAPEVDALFGELMGGKGKGKGKDGSEPDQQN